MTTVAILSAILTLLAGIGVFLVACSMMSSNLESLSSDKLKNLFAKASGSKLLGVGIGTLGTAAIQSSGATTVMVIGFVNAGIISLTQAATMIYGANIGTTITAQIVALGMFGGNSISTSVIFSAFAGLGAFLALFTNKEFWKKIGGILTGFGMLFVGLVLMSSSMSDFAALEGVKVFLAGISNPLLLVLIGTLLTAIVQSSSVMTSIALAMVVSNLITLDQGIYLTMGSNIGSCVVALIAGLTSGTNAKRTSIIHLIFNCSGVVIFLIAALLMNIFSGGDFSFGNIFNRMFPDAPQTQLAMFHTIFNLITVIIVLPMTGLLVNLVCKIIPEKIENEDPNAPKLYFIDEHMLRTPPVAVKQTKEEIINMSKIAYENFSRAVHMIKTLDLSELETFNQKEKELNFLNGAIIDFVVKLSEKQQLSEADHVYLSTTYRTVRDLERIGDYAENIIEYAEILKESSSSFSKYALAEIDELEDLIQKLYTHVMLAYDQNSIEELDVANELEEQVDIVTKNMEDMHIERLSQGICTPTVGAQYLSFSTNAERIADHLINVGKTARVMTNRRQRDNISFKSGKIQTT